MMGQLQQIHICQCIEAGKQTNIASDGQLNDERDTAIETLTLDLNSIQHLVADAAAAKTEEEKARKIRKIQEEKEETRKRKTTSRTTQNESLRSCQCCCFQTSSY